MPENSTVRVPVADHGLHSHPYNFPFLGTANFMECFPVYMKPLEKGESDYPNGGVFSRLMPLVNSAFVTGRYTFRSYYVPTHMIYKPYYNFREQRVYSHGKVNGVPNHLPEVSQKDLSNAFIRGVDGYAFVTAGTAASHDIAFGHSGATPDYYNISVAGSRVMKILMALGCTPTFNDEDTDTVLLTPVFAYLKLFYDHVFPKQYSGTTDGFVLRKFSNLDYSENTLTLTDLDDLMKALLLASTFYYDESIFDNAFDNPACDNAGIYQPSLTISDVSNNAASGGNVVTNDSDNPYPSTAGAKPTNGTPYVGSNFGGSTSAAGVLTKFVLDSLNSLSMWLKRRQLSGGKLIDSFLVNRGYKLGHEVANESYFLGQKSLEINVQPVENNSDTNLGELAGKAVASTDAGKPLEFKCEDVADDGFFMILCFVKPDASVPIYFDAYNARHDFNDFYQAAYDKLGVEMVERRFLTNSLSGVFNSSIKGKAFGFLNRYYADIQERPRLIGDFAIPSRGANELSSYHSFRLLGSGVDMVHSLNWLEGSRDIGQYQRFFYNDMQQCDNFMIFIRWFGKSQQHKLPLGDSYDWDDDEANKKVSIVYNQN